MQSSSFCVAYENVVSYRGDAYLTFTDCGTVDRAYVSVACSACHAYTPLLHSVLIPDLYQVYFINLQYRTATLHKLLGLGWELHRRLVVSHHVMARAGNGYVRRVSRRVWLGRYLSLLFTPKFPLAIVSLTLSFSCHAHILHGPRCYHGLRLCRVLKLSRTRDVRGCMCQSISAR
jgi:hypothetical protein